MVFMNLDTMQFPVYFGDIWIEYPEFAGKMGEWPNTYALVKQTQIPQYDPELQKIEFDTPVLVEGQYETRYKIVNFTPEELKIKQEVIEELNGPNL